jgi:hypothetical protein
MLTEIGTIGGLVGLTVSIALLTWQSHSTAIQSKINNAIAAASVLDDYNTGLREIFAHFIARPNLRAYFYEGKPCPTRGQTCIRVLTIAEMLADTLESGLVAHRLIPASESYEDWQGYCRDILNTSPALAGLVRDHAAWWPQLARLRQTMI